MQPQHWDVDTGKLFPAFMWNNLCPFFSLAKSLVFLTSSLFLLSLIYLPSPFSVISYLSFEYLPLRNILIQVGELQHRRDVPTLIYCCPLLVLATFWLGAKLHTVFYFLFGLCIPISSVIAWLDNPFVIRIIADSLTIGGFVVQTTLPSNKFTNYTAASIHSLLLSHALAVVWLKLTAKIDVQSSAKMLRLLVTFVTLAANALSVASSIMLIENTADPLTSNEATWILTAVGLVGNGEDGYLVLQFICKSVKAGVESGGPAAVEEPETEERKQAKKRKDKKKRKHKH